MPRDGSNIYSQPFPNVVTDTTVESTVYNGFVADIATDLNAPRPIIAGGTGADDAEEARFNLSTGVATQVVTNYDSHVFWPGGFRSATSATSPPVASHAFAGVAYINEPLALPPTNQNVVIIARDMTDTTEPGPVYVRRKLAGTWSAWTNEQAILIAASAIALDAKVDVIGDTMTGHLSLPTGPAAANAVRKDYVDAADTAVSSSVTSSLTSAYTAADAVVTAAYIAADTNKIGGSTGNDDNRILRADGTGTKTAQPSSIVLADTTGDLSHASGTGLDIQGTNTNDSAPTGYKGEFLENSRTLSGAITMGASGTIYEIASIPLGAGDWDVYAIARFLTGTTTTRLQANISTTSAAAMNFDTKGHMAMSMNATANDPFAISIPPTRFNLPSAATVYLNSGQVFVGGSPTGYGHLMARRPR